MFFLSRLFSFSGNLPPLYKVNQSFPCPSVSIFVPISPPTLLLPLSISPRELMGRVRSFFLTTGEDVYLLLDACVRVSPEDVPHGCIWTGSRNSIDSWVTVSRRVCRRAQAGKQHRKPHTHMHLHTQTFQECWKNSVPCR